jgi:uncharacterized protein with PIN domain
VTTRRPSSVRLTLRVGPTLALFLGSARHGPDVDVVAEPRATLGHVLQSVGVPLTEVGGLRLGNAGIASTELVCTLAGTLTEPAAVVDVVPVHRPQSTPTAPPRFVLDVHLGRLARQLRLLGLDVLYDRDADDAGLTVLAAAQHRVLLTQDRGLLKRQHLPRDHPVLPEPGFRTRAWVAAYVRGTTTAQQRLDVLGRFAPDLAPWTRCPACNGALRPVAKSTVLGDLQPGTRRTFEEFARCQACGQVYWHGAHSARLDELVAASTEYAAAARQHLGSVGGG